MKILFLPFLLAALPCAAAFVLPCPRNAVVTRKAFGLAPKTKTTRITCPFMTQDSTPSADDSDEKKIDDEGAALAAELAEFAKKRKIKLTDEEMKAFDDEGGYEDEEEDDELVPEAEKKQDDPQPIVDEKSQVKKEDTLSAELAEIAKKRKIKLTDRELHEFDDEEEDDEQIPEGEKKQDDPQPIVEEGSQVKKEAVRSPKKLLDVMSRPGEEEDGDKKRVPLFDEPLPYTPPKKVPDPDLSPAEVVSLILDALKNNDIPERNKGVEILLKYSSPNSLIKQQTNMGAWEYADFLKTDRELYKLFEYEDYMIEKERGGDSHRAFITARIRVGPKAMDAVYAKFRLSLQPLDNGNFEDCWMVDSLSIPPKGIRHR